jgi:hypothetical protein
MFRLAAPLLISASALNDETSLMQGMKPAQQVSGKVDKSKAISSLLETATSMLKNGETSDVVAFADATLAEIMNDVLPAIQDAHDADQTLIDNTFTMFEAALANLELENGEVKRLHDAERELSRQHIACREEEKIICDDKRECDYDLYATWLRFVEEEYELRRLSKEVEDHFCVENANGTMWVFRDHSVTLFPPWLEQKPIVEHWEYEYNRRVPTCETWYTTLNEKTDECDALQAHLEAAACAHANEVLNVRIRFATDWQYSVYTYQQVVDEVRCLELDRWKEWRTLTTVQCLLRRTDERNGRPCDESTDEITDEVAHCEQEQYDVSIEHLRITYHEVPDFPPLCLAPPWGDASYVPGRCVPQHPEAPCTAGFLAQEYAVPEVISWTPPQPVFHSENSHCNQRPECQDCALVVEPHWCLCLYLWAYGDHTGYWVNYPGEAQEGTCHEATAAQLDAGFYSRINVGTSENTECHYAAAEEAMAGPEQLDFLQLKLKEVTQGK